MADPDLEDIRRARIAQLQQSQKSPDSVTSNEATHKQASEARQSILSQILTPDAADRLGRIRLVKESRASDAEDRLLMLAKSGQLRERVTEQQLKELLTALTTHEEKTGKSEGARVVIHRRGATWDDSEDDL